MLTNEQKIKLVLENEYMSGYLNGLQQGRAAAERIYLWYSSNHKMLEPHSLEKLEQWATKELKDLLDKIIETRSKTS